MNVDGDSVDAQILRELGEIKATQGYIQTDIMDIKTEIREIKDAYKDMDSRVRNLETRQTECQAKADAKTSVISRAGAFISAAISAGVALFVALVTSGRL